MEPPYPDPIREDDAAFLQMERGFRRTLDSEITRGGREPAFAELSYVNNAFAAADALRIEALAHLTHPDDPIVKSPANLHYLRDEIDQALVALRLQKARSDPAPPLTLPKDHHQRLGVLISHILGELDTAQIPNGLRHQALLAARQLQSHHAEHRVRMEDFVGLGHAIASIGRLPASEASADTCWRWLRLGMGLVSGSSRAPTKPPHPGIDADHIAPANPAG